MYGVSPVRFDFSRCVETSVLSGSTDGFGGFPMVNPGGGSFVRFKWNLFHLHEELSAVSTSYELSSSLFTITPFFHSFCPSVNGFILTVSPSPSAGKSWALQLYYRACLFCTSLSFSLSWLFSRSLAPTDCQLWAVMPCPPVHEPLDWTASNAL